MTSSKIYNLISNREYYCDLVAKSIMEDDEILAHVYMLFANHSDQKLRECKIIDLGYYNE